jgi:hypothetical protein
MRRFIYKQEYVRPEATRVSDGVVVRLKHYEVDPELMGQQFAQQDMPAWDTLRIVEDRNDHLNWMHEHFADETLVAGQESESNPPLLTPGCLDHHSRDLVGPACWRPHPGFDGTRRRRHQLDGRPPSARACGTSSVVRPFSGSQGCECVSFSSQSIRTARTFRRESPRHVNQRHLCGE